ncbi:DUF4079 family protein [Synechococcales cyanobacterium C]|uniref:DUF4079 family protein n=1 Tax=Petrachloros mirabilis ULC683 TaxID=2781853 RepID=A0A8K2A1K1_9CYAN|nr:DUF4079 domain-containing protein [Petrachloros mirabilis]NCJ07762.1 DUF4079 family protein [Petrachloros mirabilis ULC683]
MDLPTFLWLWKIAAWSMGLAWCAYALLATSGLWLRRTRRGGGQRPPWLQWIHYSTGLVLVLLVLLLLAIGIIGTLGHYGSLGHSWHLAAGGWVVVLVLTSAASATQIGRQNPWARRFHVSVNITLLGTLIWVSGSGWAVVQKYLP